MSRTKRAKDPYHSLDDKKWKETRDKKPWSKPNSRFKKNKKTKTRAAEHAVIKKINAAIPAVVDEIVLPKVPKNNVWEWN